MSSRKGKGPKWPCGTCRKSANTGAILCVYCRQWIHVKGSCSGSNLKAYRSDPSAYKCPCCKNSEQEIDDGSVANSTCSPRASTGTDNFATMVDRTLVKLGAAWAPSFRLHSLDRRQPLQPLVTTILQPRTSLNAKPEISDNQSCQPALMRGECTLPMQAFLTLPHDHSSPGQVASVPSPRPHTPQEPYPGMPFFNESRSPATFDRWQLLDFETPKFKRRAEGFQPTKAGESKRLTEDMIDIATVREFKGRVWQEVFRYARARVDPTKYNDAVLTQFARKTMHATLKAALLRGNENLLVTPSVISYAKAEADEHICDVFGYLGRD